jgi:hypothetical protein
VADDSKVDVVLRTGAAVTVYSNNITLEVSPFDFRLRFRRYGDVDVSAGKGTIDELAVVYVSPPQAKALLAILRRQIERYESKHGEIIAVGAAAESDDDATMVVVAVPTK